MEEEDILKIQSELNSRPISRFDNLSPSDMKNLLYNPFSTDSIIQFKKGITSEAFNQIGFFKMIEFLLDHISEKEEVTLTKWNNLNTKLVTQIYKLNHTGEEVIQLRERKVYKQDDLISLQNAIIILNNILKFTKIRKGKISLTKKGISALTKENRDNLLKSIFETYALRLNWSYHDGFPDEHQIQSTFGYTLYLVLRYGNQERGTSFYSKKLIKAFPDIIHEFKSSWSTPEEQINSCLRIRCFERFLNWFNFITVRKSYNTKEHFDKTYIKNNLIYNILELDKNKFKFQKPEFYA